MATMQAVQFDSYGAAEVLRIQQVRIPVPERGQVLVRVGGTTINPHDLFLRAGKARLISGRKFPLGSGSDFAGEVVGLGAGADQYAVGDRVWGFNPGLAHIGSAAAAEYLAVAQEQIALAPAGLSDVEAASMIAGGTVSIVAFRDKVSLKAGERVLVRGATGGVGSIAVQYAASHGAHVTALASANNLDLARSLGAEVALDHRTVSAADLGEFDVIFDAVGRQLARYRRRLAPGGRMVSIAVGSPADAAYIVASAVHGSRRVRFFSGAPKHDLFVDLTAEVDQGHLVPVIDTVYPLDAVREAHQAVERGGSRGKHVLRITSAE